MEVIGQSLRQELEEARDEHSENSSSGDSESETGQGRKVGERERRSGEGMEGGELDESGLFYITEEEQVIATFCFTTHFWLT